MLDNNSTKFGKRGIVIIVGVTLFESSLAKLEDNLSWPEVYNHSSKVQRPIGIKWMNWLPCEVSWICVNFRADDLRVWKLAERRQHEDAKAPAAFGGNSIERQSLRGND
ncbi:MAG: hypothetical protein ACTS46_00720 [Candidatus Hodgkinia cicadicola]